MNQPVTTNASFKDTLANSKYLYLFSPFFAGLLLPFGFAPFHLPGLSLLGIALLYAQLGYQQRNAAFLTGFIFGLGYFGFGVSWVYVSIHEYGHIHGFLSGLITLLFIFFLSLYPGLMALAYKILGKNQRPLASCLLFCALWCLSEYLRSTLMGGFPWLLLGTGQMDTPLKEMLPIVGLYGVSFLACFAATSLVMFIQTVSIKRYLWIMVFVGVLLTPSLLTDKIWVNIWPTPLSTGIVQANLSMRDKWDEALFWELMNLYKNSIDQLIAKKTKLIILPESAIPLPSYYISDFLETIDIQAKQVNSTVLTGIIEDTNLDGASYYNALKALGEGNGFYIKQHLVPFGEYTPKPFEQMMKWLNFPMSNMISGHNHQNLLEVDHHPIASLICYELAFPSLVRKQLPDAELIVSVSDDGWFGHSLAIYQQLQIAQTLAKQTARYHVTVNNDGLSSIIDTQGNIVSSLPTFTSGLLEGDVYPAHGMTPWAMMGDKPVLWMDLLIVVLGILSQKKHGMLASRKAMFS